MAKRVVIITGISSGMGRVASQYFHKKGWIVYGGARRVDKLKALEKMGINTQELDVTDPASNQALIDRVMQEQGRIDVLINNAGYGEYGALEEVAIADAKKQFDVNVFGLADITQKVLPIMRQQKSGRIINNSSIGGRIYMPLGGWYHASKHAVEVYSDVLRMEMKKFGVHVSVIEPGGTKTEWGEVAMQNAQKATAADSPYKPTADAISAMISKESSFMMAEPIKIVKLMYRAATEPRPKHRYLPGIFEILMTFLARKLPVKTFDLMVEKFMKI